MPANYIEQSGGIDYCNVISTQYGNYACAMSHDGTTILCESTHLSPGYYSLDLSNEQTDENIISSVTSFYSQSVNPELGLGNNTSVLDFVIHAIHKTHQDDILLPISGLPKLTKGICKSLSGLQELLVLYKDSNEYKYLCMGYRKPIAEYMDQYKHEPIFISPERFYTVANFETRFNPNVFAYYKNYIMVITPDQTNLDKIGIMLTYDWNIHSGWIEKDITT